MNFKRIIGISLFIIATGLINGQSFSEKRTLQRTIKAGSGTNLEVINKYGSVHVTSSEADSISIRVEIEASASSLDKMRKVFDGININISETNFTIRAQTEFTQNINMMFESFKGMTSKIISYDSKIEINYFVSVPDYINLKIENKYGDVSVENNSGDFAINLSNGSLKANSLNRVSEMNLSFCDAAINRINNGSIDASFSELFIGESETLRVNSISSRVELRKAGTIDSKSRRDKFFIGSVESVTGNSYFTDYKIDALVKEVNMMLKYGNVEIGLIEKSTKLVSFKSSYTDLNMKFEPSLDYNIDIRYVNVFLVLPDHKKSQVEKKTINEDKKEYTASGAIGPNPQDTKVIIDANRGNIYLK
jgi:hypothetical protein